MRFCVSIWYVFFFFQQKTAYEMRISDWSSDVCSSDLIGEQVVDLGDFGAIGGDGRAGGLRIDQLPEQKAVVSALHGNCLHTPANIAGAGGGEIGRASCRERV